jgi:hypothetical protein
MSPFRTATVTLVAVLAAGAGPVFAQFQSIQDRPRTAPATPAQSQPVVAQPPQGPVVLYQGQTNARDVQSQLREILEAYPPSLRQLIRLDPSLMQREDFMAPYPALTAFLQQHPEIMRNPGFYFGEQYFEREQTDRERMLSTVRGTIDGIGFLTGFLVVITLVYSLLRQALEYRRWRRQIQVQTDVHTKLLDRMTNNQELLAYIETSAGRRFLEAPVPLMAAGPSMSLAPVARILWSAQIGVVVVAAGIGFWIARASVEDVDLASVFQVMGSLAIAVGVGFVVSALMSWVLSQRMGLIQAAQAKVE